VRGPLPRRREVREALETSSLLVGGLAVVVACALVAKRYGLPYPIVLVLAGLGLAFVPHLPAVHVDPGYIFLIVLPPLLFSAGWTTDWALFKANARPIFMLAVGLVVLTTVAVAVVAHALGFPWGPAFVLGAVISPPDAVAPGALFERFAVPRRIRAILEGEGLVNDGSALVIYRFAVAATVSGMFSPGAAAFAFVVVAAGGIAFGFAIGLLIEGLGHTLTRFELSDSLIDNLIFLIAPYAAYLGAETFGLSGVLATAVVGIYLSRRSSFIYRAETRLTGSAAWSLMIYLINGFVFLTIGLQVREMMRDPRLAWHTIGIALAISAVAIVARIFMVAATASVTRALERVFARSFSVLPRRWNVVVAWTGLRGIVSLAAALALPLRDAAGSAFPQREAIVFITFVVILVTLVVQGLMLIPILRRLHLKEEAGSTEEREIEVRVAALRAGLASVTALEAGALDPEKWQVIGRNKDEYEHRIEHLQSHVPGSQTAESPASRFDHDVQEKALRAEREAIMRLRNEGNIPDEIFRRIEHDLDLAESRLT
jgi:monovalent cation/hydrogen antiporter